MAASPADRVRGSLDIVSAQIPFVSFRDASFTPEQSSNGVDKAPGRPDGGSRVVGRDRVDRGTDAVIGDRFEFVPFSEKSQEFAFDAWLLPCQPTELASDAAMRFGGLAGALEDIRLSGMVGGKVRLARGDIRKPRGSDGLGANETVTCLIQILGLRASQIEPIVA